LQCVDVRARRSEQQQQQQQITVNEPPLIYISGSDCWTRSQVAITIRERSARLAASYARSRMGPSQVAVARIRSCRTRPWTWSLQIKVGNLLVFLLCDAKHLRYMLWPLCLCHGKSLVVNSRSSDASRHYH